MNESHIPNYAEYNDEFLVDVYSRIDRESNPLKAAALDEEIKKRFNLSPEEEINPETIKKIINVYKKKSNTSKGLLSKHEKMIKEGWIAGLVLGTISFLTWFISMLTNKNVLDLPVDPFGLVDILLIFGLTYGIYRKSRFCAVAMTIYYFIMKLYMIAITFPTGIFSIIWLAILTTFFVRAMIGTFEYHREQENFLIEDSTI